VSSAKEVQFGENVPQISAFVKGPYLITNSCSAIPVQYFADNQYIVQDISL